ncbi:F-box protein At2g35280-like [Rutidosis leptorrhynchoides]|uniref:F-box protein At2g35280-like n=1 Tax=Rutidosis leptorrhynchoides TaxID=125765 RepID=UPI003A9A63D1
MDVRVKHANILEDVPQDMLVEILSRVGQKSSAQLFMVKLVCKAFRKLSNDALVYKRLSFDRWCISPWGNHKLADIFISSMYFGNPNAIFRNGLRAYFDSKYPDVGIHLLEKALNMQLKEACYVYGLVMFASHQIEKKDIGLQILNQTFPPVPNLVVEVRTMVFDLIRRCWVLFNHHPFDDVAMCCTIKVHNAYFPLDHGWKIILTKPECMSCFWSYELRVFAERFRFN